MNDIVVNGIKTNNLKEIDIRLRKKAINLIIGPSGSGKSSLAYDTIAQIGLSELGAMYSDGTNEPDYEVDSYSNMLVTVPIKQLNSNNNVRSTIGTYFSLNPCLAKIYSSLLGIPYDYFVLNKSENVCPYCMGIGYSKRLDPVKIVDYDKTLEQVPIRCWNRNKDFYQKIITCFCEEQGISVNKKFRQLSDKEQSAILSGQSAHKYSIKYKSAGRISTRTTAYYGVLTDKPMLKNFSPSRSFFTEQLCEKCGGKKFENGHEKAKICGLSIGEVMLLHFKDVIGWLDTLKNKYDYSKIEFSLRQIEVFAKKAAELNLGYLFMNRNIPSLSGGELQRLRLIKVLASQLTDLLIVLDEPLAGLSSKEKTLVYDNILRLSERHTLLIVDHHSMFVDKAATIIALGEGSGIKGGSLINPDKYLEQQAREFKIDVLPPEKWVKISLSSKIYSYKGVNIKIAANRMNVISGASGVGKSTLLREYLTQFFDDYTYVSQKPLAGNSHSTVATSLGIQNKICTFYSKHFHAEKSLFSNMPSAEGACRSCGGTGFITFGSDSQSQITLKCKDCRGTGFDKKLDKYKIKEKSLLDIFEMTIDEAAVFFGGADKAITDALHDAQSLLLGHLVIGEKTSDLSGGENIRIKLLKAAPSKDTVIGIDEPFKGLNNEEIHKIVLFLNRLIDQGKTIIVVDHEEACFKYFSHHIELQNINGVLSGG